MKKSKGSITLTVFIFLIAFSVFCICAIDAGYIVAARYKAQKITETTALYMVSVLNSKPAEERTAKTLQDIKDGLEDLYSDFSGYSGFKISGIQIKNETTNPKIKIVTETYTPTMFLRYVGIGLIKIIQTSYAKSYEETMQLVKSDPDSYTYKTGDIITDKNGNDIKVDYSGDYFIFAGLEDFDKQIHWAQIGSMTKDNKKTYHISNTALNYKAQCISNKGETFFDLSSDPDKTIGLVKYIKIYKADCTDNKDNSADLPQAEITPSSDPVVTILNSVKLIKRNDF